MKRGAAALFLLLFSLLLLFPALADEHAFSDPVPGSLAPLLQESVQDCICFAAPDGAERVFLIMDGGWSLREYALLGGEWRMEVDSTPLEGYLDVFFSRHRAEQLRPDGSAYGDSQGFDIVSRQGPYESFHWNGEAYTLCGWRDETRYGGAVMIEGTVLRYFPQGSPRAEYEADAGTAMTLYSWTWSFDDVPATPEEARRRAAILPSAIEKDFPGYALEGYQGYGDGMSADAEFVQADGGFLRIIRAGYDAETGRTSAYSLMGIPLSPRLGSMPAETLRRDWHTLLTQPDALDSAQIPLPGRIIALHPQREQWALLVEDDGGSRRAAAVSQDEKGEYHVSLSPVLPDGAGMDDFHAGENEIYLTFGCTEVGYAKTADGAWRLSWVMSGMDYTVSWYGVQWEDDNFLIGALPGTDLFTADFSAIPVTEEELKKAVDASGWAAVNNPNPKDRLHLRSRPYKSADSLGKFYNGTPVRILETRGDWCRVRLGNDGPEGWMMKKYLAFSQAANRVNRAFPQLWLKEKYESREMAAWADGTRKIQKTLNPNEAWEIMGVLDDLYILVGKISGTVVYAPMDWFWEGNG